MRNEISDIRFKDIIVEVTPTLDTSVYADEDILFQSTEIADAIKSAGVSYLNSIMITDKDDQGGAFDLYFFRSDVTLAALNAAEAMSDDVLDEIITVVSVAGGNYINLANGQVAVKGPSDGGMMVSLQPSSSESTESIYVGAVSQDAKTYTASGLVFKFGFIRS